MNFIQQTVAVPLLVACLGTAACTRVPHTDPLAEWKRLGSITVAPVPEVIKQDARAYFQTMPAHDRREATNDYAVDCRTDGGGQYAVVLYSPEDGEHWNYALIYDRDGRRLKVLKYSTGSYHS